MKTKFELLDGAVELFGLTPREAIAHLSKKIELPTIIPAKQFVTPTHVEAGMFHYAEENLIFPDIIPKLVIDSVIGSWNNNKGIGLCRDQERLPWSSDCLVVGNQSIRSGFEATQMILAASERTGKKAEAAQYCAKYAKYGITPGQAFMVSKFEAEKILPNTLKIDKAFQLLKAAKLGEYLWSSSEYNSNNAWYSNFSYTNGLNYTNKNYNNYVRPVLALSI